MSRSEVPTSSIAIAYGEGVDNLNKVPRTRGEDPSDADRPEDEKGLSSSSETASASSASSGDTAITDYSMPLATSCVPAEGKIDISKQSSTVLDNVSGHATFEHLKGRLVWPIWNRSIANAGTEPFTWFSASTVPSPAAFYFWRRDQCELYKMRLASQDEVEFYEYFIDANYHDKIKERIKGEQRLYQQHLWRCQEIIDHNDAILSGHIPPNVNPTEHELYERVDWIFNGVAEAICRHSLPPLTLLEDSAQTNNDQAPPAAEKTVRNKKGFPLVYYFQRNNFSEQWNEYCRTQGFNAQNILYDYVPFASHNPYSLYHKVKYGDYGSPHPYVPFSITHAKEWRKSCEYQARQETEALTWLAQRRKRIGTTQQQLDWISLRLRKGQDDVPGEPRVADVANNDHPESSETLIPIGLSDDVVIDQEVEQPQAMGVQDAATPLMSSEVANSTHNCYSAEALYPRQAIAGGTDTLNNTTMSAATSISHPITVSVMVPEEIMPRLRCNIYNQLKKDHTEKLAYLCDTSTRRLLWPKILGRAKEPNTAAREEEEIMVAENSIDSCHTSSQVSSSSRQLPPIIRLKPEMNMSVIVTDDEVAWRSGGKVSLHKSTQKGCDGVMLAHSALPDGVIGPRGSSRNFDESDEPPPSFKLGNLFLSSCPGKKVRLTGAVRGRGAVCRDLSIDLQRFKALGVGTLVCCLSDAELGVIGVTWEEYLEEADKLGLDLVRIPMVEGNCPTSREYLDAWLEEIVLHCTLKGVNVLVHCRGGVGRAGTIAACWLIKMGLVDEFRSPKEVIRRGEVSPGREILWQSLQVVRMRRSSKAIETAEQAAYITKYGEYLIAKWQKQNPGKEYLDREYRDMVSSYWERIRWETDLWVRQKRREAEERKEGAGATGDPITDVGSSAKNGHHSHIRTQSAATVATPGSQGKEPSKPVPTSPKTRYSNGSPTVIQLASHPSPQDYLPHFEDSLTSISLPSNIDGAANGSHETPPAKGDLGRSDEGEPSRKRRNTTSLTVDAIRLSDVEDAIESLSSGETEDGDLGGGEVDLDMDEFPVNGRRSEEGWPVSRGSLDTIRTSRHVPESSILNGDEVL